MDLDRKKLYVLQKELKAIQKQEMRMEQSALKSKPSALKPKLVGKVPAKVYSGLESAFCKGFATVFDQGRPLIEKSYKRESLSADHAVRDYAFELKGSRKELKQLKKATGINDLLNLTATSLEGIGLGALGVGLPDIVIFLAMLLRGVYEKALSYGFDYVSKRDKLLILKMLETSLSMGEDWAEHDKQVDELFMNPPQDVSALELELATRSCASAFAEDMILLKFVQGFPIVGIIGGVANPVYYNKILKYVGLKYKKHYLLNKMK